MVDSKDIAEIKAILNELKHKPNEAILMGSTSLTSTNTTLNLNPEYFYFVSIKCVNLPTTDNTINIIYNGKQANQKAVLTVNASGSLGYEIDSLKINEISISSSFTSTASVNIAFIACERASHPKIKSY